MPTSSRRRGTLITTYIDSRLLAATQVRKIRNDIRSEVPLAAATLLLISFGFGLVWGELRAGLLFGAAVLAILLLQLPLLLWAGVDLNPAELEVHKFGRRRIAWHDIQLLTAEKSWGTVRMVVWTVRGERIALRAPTMLARSAKRERFVYDFHTIEQYWQAYRGPYWQPATVWTRPEFRI